MDAQSKTFYFILLYLAFGKVVLGLFWTLAANTKTLRAHRVFAVDVPPTQRLREIKSSWHVISDAVVLWALVALGLINLAPDTWVNGLITFVVFYVWVETWYYFTHRLMHKYDWLYRYHRSHHLSLVVTPLSSISMSNVEKWIFYTGGWLGFMAAISWVLPVSLYGIVAYYTYHFIISLHGHSNFEASSVNKLFTKMNLGSATSHAIHHARFRANYGFSCMVWDKILGTYASDTPKLQENAINKAGANSIKVRFTN